MTKTYVLPLAVCIALMGPLTAVSQETASETVVEDEQDPGFLEKMIQNALGGDGREVRIVGLEGPLSADVKIAAIEVADPNGTWLTIRNVEMSWRRLALLRGRVEIDALTIGSIDLLRSPETPPAPAPSIEADPTPPEPFSLPDLPVSIELGSFGVGRLDLGQPVIGQAASLSIDGGATLAGGEGGVRLQIVRLDGPEGLIALDAGFENETRRLYVNLDVEEAAGGLIAHVAKFPDNPSVDLSISGDNPISDFVAQINLATDNAERLAGTVELQQTAEAEPLVTTITADIGGDITPLFLPQYQDFFGEDVQLNARVLLDSEEGTKVDNFDLASRALNLSGTASLAANGLPELVDVQGKVGTDDGLPVTLPLSGPITTLNSALLRMDYDASEGDAFIARVGVLGLRQEDLAVGTIDLSLDGTLARGEDEITVAGVTSEIRARLQGISTGDEDVDSALSGQTTFDADLAFDPTAATITLRDIALLSGDLRLDGEVDVTDLGGATTVAAQADMTTGDLDRFAPIVKKPLDGSFDGKVAAQFVTTSGAFDVDLTGLAQDLAIGNPQVDGLLVGRSDLALVARRNADGIVLENLDIRNPQLFAKGTGSLSSASAALDLEAEVNEASLLAEQFAGPLTVTAKASGNTPNFNIAVEAGGTAITDILGDGVVLNSDLVYEAAEGHLGVPSLSLTAGDLTATGNADVTGLDDVLAVAAELDLSTGNLARFAELAQIPLAGTFDGAVKAAFDTETTAFDVDMNGRAQSLAIGNPQVDQLLLGRSDLIVIAQGDLDGVELENLDISNPQLSAKGSGTLSREAADLTINAQLNEASMVAPTLTGPLSVAATATGTAPNFNVMLEAGGAAITDVLGDPVTLDSDLVYEAEAGHLGVPKLSLTAGELTAMGDADITGLNDALALVADLDLKTGDLARFGPLVDKPLGGTLDATVKAAFASDTGDFTADLNGNAQDIAIGSPQVDELLAGATVIDAKARRENGTIVIDTLTVDNPELQVNGGGTFSPEAGDLTLSANLADLGLFVPQLQGPLTLDTTAKGAGSAWAIDLNAEGPQGLKALINGGVASTDTDLDIDIALGNLGAFVSELPGPVTVKGKVTGDGTDYYVDVDATAPAGLTAAVDGRAYGPDGTMDIAVTGDIPLNIADGFIKPRSLEGNAQINLTVNGEPGVETLSGAITMDGARFSDPSTRIVLEQMGLNLTLDRGNANLDFRGNLETGGQIRVSGPVALTDPYNGDITVTLDSLKLVDPQLYEIDVEGQIRLSGALAGGASISGRIDIPRAEISIPDATGGGGVIPEMTHVSENASSRQTRQRAGLIKETREDGATGAPVAYPLDLVISAPARIFIRGRGLDTEFGGEIEIGGTSARLVPSGRFELIRGRMNILNRLLIFSEAVITLGGDLVPDLYMVAVSENAPIDASIEIEGPVSDPELTFSSTPELPEDEVLAQLFFGKPVSDLTPLEVAGLLSAISTLSGRGGGVFGKIRDGIGVDQLNVGTDSDGQTEVTAGKYLSEDVYSDVTVNAEGESRVQLNFEITDEFTVRGGFDSTGDTRVGLSFERDY